MTTSTPAADSLILTDGTQITDSHHGISYRGYSAEAQIVANWHNETHAGPFQFCTEQPCHAIVRADR